MEKKRKNKYYCTECLMEIKKDFQFDEGYAWHKECYDKFAEKMNRLNHRTRKIRY